MELKYLYNKYLNTVDKDLKREHRSYLISYIRIRCEKNNQNFLTIIEGDTGTGKSFCALRLAEELDPYFNKDRIFFSVKDFAMKMAKHKYKSGSVFVFEEAQQGAHNLNFQSQTNKGLFYILSTFRHDNYICIFTLPHAITLDSQVRRLFHGCFRTTGKIDRKKNLCKLNISFPLQHPTKRDTVYPMKLKIGNVAVPSVWLGKPSREIIKEYDKKKDNYTSTLNNAVAVELSPSLIKTTKKK